jgi:hypothetical protein
MDVKAVRSPFTDILTLVRDTTDKPYPTDLSVHWPCSGGFRSLSRPHRQQGTG